MSLQHMLQGVDASFPPSPATPNRERHPPRVPQDDESSEVEDLRKVVQQLKAENEAARIDEGNHKDDKKNGHGVYRYADGDVYEGNFKDDERSGHGVYRYTEGKVEDGLWKDNVFQE